MGRETKYKSLSHTHNNNNYTHNQNPLKTIVNNLNKKARFDSLLVFFLVRAKNPTTNSYLIQPFGGAGHAAL